MDSERSTRDSGRTSKNLQRMAVMLAPVLLAACGGDANSAGDSNSAAGGNGNIQESEITVMRKAESETTPDIRKMDIANITCSAEGESLRTRVEFEDGGFAQAEPRSKQGWQITVGLPELEFTLRDLIFPSHGDSELVFDSAGNLTGPHAFRTEVNSDDPVTYGIIFDIVC